MFIIRVATNNGKEDKIRTFTFEDQAELNRAVACLRQTTCKGFSADVDEPGAQKGHLLERWDRSDKFNCNLYHDIQWGPYKDRIFETYGFKDECDAAAKQTNDNATCWASRRANVSHVAGDLYSVRYVDPFTD